MKVFYGNSFTTDLKFQGVLPTLPNQGDYNPEVLSALVTEVTNETLDAGLLMKMVRLWLDSLTWFILQIKWG